MRRFDPGYVEMKQALGRGAIGTPLLTHCISRGVSSAPGATNESSVTGSAIHEFDVLPWLLDSPITEVSWHAPKPTAAAGGFQDPQLILLRTADGVLSTVEVFLNARYGYDIRCEMVGESGTLALTEPAKMITDGSRARSVGLRGRLASPVRRRLPASNCRPGSTRSAPAPGRRWRPRMTGWWPMPLRRPSSRPCTAAARWWPSSVPTASEPRTQHEEFDRRMSAFPTTLPAARTPDPMAAPPLRWGVIGPGWIAERFIGSVRRHTRQQVLAVASRDLGRSTAFAAQARRRPGVRVLPGTARRPGHRRRLHRDPAQRALPVRAAVAAGRQAHPGGEADRAERHPGHRAGRSWRRRRACSSPRRCGRCSCRSST